MRSEEQRLHDEHRQDSDGAVPYLWSGCGEWFLLLEEDVDKIAEGYAELDPPKEDFTNGMWQRMGRNWNIRFDDLQNWCNLGWVRAADFAINNHCGKFVFTGIPDDIWGNALVP